MKSPTVSSAAMAIITDLVNSVYHGTITLIVQDSRLLQVDRNDKIRLDSLEKVRLVKLNPLQSERLYQRLHEELNELQYGQVTLTVKNGVIVQIERIEKQRVSGLEGIYGDGI